MCHVEERVGGSNGLFCPFFSLEIKMTILMSFISSRHCAHNVSWFITVCLILLHRSSFYLSKDVYCIKTQ